MTTVRPVYTAWHGRSGKDRWCHTRTYATLDLATGEFADAEALEKAKSDADVAVSAGLLGWVTDAKGERVYTAAPARV